MGTKCLIKIEDFDVAALYKHSDGYPAATLSWLLDFNARWVAYGDDRKIDASYKFAQLVRDSVFSAKKFNLEKNRETGWGVVPHDMDCYSDYIYELMTNGNVSYAKN